MLKIFGHPASTCTRKVLMTCAENDTAYELTTVDFAKGEHKQQPHLSRQPFGQIPAIDDDGFAIYESRAIARYIDEKAGGKLVPKDLKTRAVMEEWISVETSNFSPHVMKFIYHHTFGRAQDAAVLETAGKGLETALGVMEARLAKSPFLAGAELTLADVCFMPYVEYAMGTPVKETFAKFPHVSAWWNKVSERPTWQKTAGRG
ncbi:MAG: putative glutathione S-transferase-like protein [Myxococcaceae bacterium]|nr:putative glutathione S-transferase-like protein [Myxococcaceae bacterium]MEA2753047.1 glutathione S-transferase [Myxococcales bacterium]